MTRADPDSSDAKLVVAWREIEQRLVFSSSGTGQASRGKKIEYSIALVSSEDADILPPRLSPVY